MAATRSKSIREGETPQYAYALAVLSGGVAFIVPQLGIPVASWHSYALLGAVFGFVWPTRAVRWGGWLCLPVILLIFVDVVAMVGIGALLSYVLILAKSLAPACLGAYLGSKLSLLKLSNRSSRSRVNGKRSADKGRGARSLQAPKKIPAPAAVTVALARVQDGPVATAVQGVYLRELNARLIEAAREGDQAGVRLLVADGADVNALSVGRWAPFTAAAEDGDAVESTTLFGLSPAPGYSVGNGWTSLMVATVEGHTEVVRALLGRGALVDAENNKGWTALRFAVSMDETEILRLLLDAGADANVADHEGKTALMQAAGENIKESLKVLLGAGADPRLKDRAGQTALSIAQKHGHAEIIKLLKEALAAASPRSGTPYTVAAGDQTEAAGKTHRVIRTPRAKYYGLVDRYDVIPVGASLPRGCEETGLEGDEEECRDYAWKSNIDEPSELGWLLGFSSQHSA